MPKKPWLKRVALRGSVAVLALAAACALSAPLRAAGASSGYLLGPQDKIRLKVFEWRASRDEVFSWKALNDEFTISADGTLSIPFVGEVPAAGHRPDEVGTEIGRLLRQRLGLAVPPDTSVEVVSYRPFYISGYVDKPGEYPFRPGLTAAMAMAIAGGVPRIVGAEGYRLEREAINSRGDISLLQEEREQLAVRLDRLHAEANDLPTMTVSPALAKRTEPSIKLMIARETSIFEARRKAFESQIAAIDDLKKFLRMQVDVLGQQMKTSDQQIKLIDMELQGITSLVERGFATQPRQLALERARAQLQGDKLRANTELLRSQESISRADIAALELRNKRKTDAELELRDTQAKLVQLGERLRTAERLLMETEVSAPRFLMERARARRGPAIIHITRRTDSGVTELAATDTTPVQPGDTLRVEPPAYDMQPLSLPLPDVLSKDTSRDILQPEHTDASPAKAPAKSPAKSPASASN